MQLSKDPNKTPPSCRLETYPMSSALWKVMLSLIHGFKWRPVWLPLFSKKMQPGSVALLQPVCQGHDLQENSCTLGAWLQCRGQSSNQGDDLPSLAVQAQSTLVMFWKGFRTHTVWERVSQLVELKLMLSPSTSPCWMVKEEMASCIIFCSSKYIVMV